MPIVQKHCPECGSVLEEKYMEGEGMIPYCPQCETYRFPFFNTAVSMICVDEQAKKILLIKQYGRPFYILVAGYVNRGESIESAVVREVKEETGMTAARITFNRSKFFEPSNTLMVNFTCYVKSADELNTNREIDSCTWFTFEEARANIKDKSLAQEFLNAWLDSQEQ